MIIKKYQADTENEAMEQVKADLGGDAIIMNIKTVRPKGIHKLYRKASVEVTAALDDNTVYQPENRTAQAASAEDAESALRQLRTLSMEVDKESAIEKRLNDLQKLIETQVAGAGTAKEAQPKEEPERVKEELREEKEPEDPKNQASGKRMACIQLIYNQLLSNEVDEKYANQIISEIESSLKKDASVDNILGAVYQKIILKLGHPEELELKEGKTKYVFFIGPTGVGKTTTIAKIASSFKLGKKANIALLTADTYRIAAVEQLRTYANILNIPLQVVYSADEVKSLKKELSGYDLVLVDTAGRSHRNEEQKADIKRLIDAVPPEERVVYLVLSATTKYGDMKKIVETYKEITDFSLLFTKLDETGTIGNILNIRMMTDSSLSYTTWGQNVPDDIGKVDVQKVAKQLLGGGEG